MFYITIPTAATRITATTANHIYMTLCFYIHDINWIILDHILSIPFLDPVCVAFPICDEHQVARKLLEDQNCKMTRSVLSTIKKLQGGPVLEHRW